MLSYRHAYHAGNHADVLKHSVLALILESLQRKHTPYCYIDTHAGAGRYNLASREADKVGEFRTGIGRVWPHAERPAALAPYVAAIAACNPGASGELRYYPGSPVVANTFLREQDRMVVFEQHPTDATLLTKEFARMPHCRVLRGDAFALLKGFLPPLEKRGLVLIDPSYEIKTDYRAVTTLLSDALVRWATGIYMLWYPLLERATADQLLRRIAASGTRKILNIEFGPRAAGAGIGLWGSGLVIVNPPYQLDEQVKKLMPWFGRVMQAEVGAPASVRWLVPE